MKNMSNYLSLIFLLSLACCGKKTNILKMDEKICYADFVDDKFIGVSSEKIKEILGDPNIVKQAKGSQVWFYRTSPEEMMKSKAEAIIGITVYFDDQGKVSHISPSRKTN